MSDTSTPSSKSRDLTKGSIAKTMPRRPTNDTMETVTAAPYHQSA
ncbi:hypothetical protein ACTXLW_08200 [Psychrobacter celer]|nr:hypothetical protein [uncultured Psychrobacter sp.]